jgi:nucleoid DNA-binding protein
MTKGELIDQVTEGTALAKKDVEQILEKTISAIQEAMKKGDKVSLTGLGVFVAVDKKARMARNPKTGEQVQVPTKRAAKFKPGKELKEILN